MHKTRLLSWNVNGLRAAMKKGFFAWMLREKPDILCVQETKAQEHQLLQELQDLVGYRTFFSSAERRGYSGVGLFTRSAPENVSTKMGIARFDSEGRFLRADYAQFTLLNVYFPNGKASKQRLQYKMDFYDAFLNYVQRLKPNAQSLVICGDVNTAHKEIDLARPKQNMKVSGFLPEERAWIDTFLAQGFFDTFRLFTAEGGHYTWWDYKTRARDRNIGWRIDYFFVNRAARNQVTSAFILPEIFGSDHCPIGIELSLSKRGRQ
jgi:exodeoxyribonuclease-3